MSELTVRVKLGGRGPSHAGPAQCRVRRPKGAARVRRGTGDRTARLLALAHHIDRLVEEGRLRDYAEAAGVLGLTRARVTQVMNLMLLAPEIQDAVVGEPPSENESAQPQKGAPSRKHRHNSRARAGLRRRSSACCAHARDPRSLPSERWLPG